MKISPNITIGTVITVVVALLGAQTFMFTNFAWSKDVQRIEQEMGRDVDSIRYTLLKSEIRDLRRLIRSEADPGYKANLQEDLNRLIDELCLSWPQDRECRR